MRAIRGTGVFLGRHPSTGMHYRLARDDCLLYCLPIHSACEAPALCTGTPGSAWAGSLGACMHGMHVAAGGPGAWARAACDIREVWVGHCRRGQATSLAHCYAQSTRVSSVLRIMMVARRQHDRSIVHIDQHGRQQPGRSVAEWLRHCCGTTQRFSVFDAARHPAGLKGPRRRAWAAVLFHLFCIAQLPCAPHHVGPHTICPLPACACRASFCMHELTTN